MTNAEAIQHITGTKGTHYLSHQSPYLSNHCAPVSSKSVESRQLTFWQLSTDTAMRSPQHTAEC
jgi:hypothetical protein